MSKLRHPAILTDLGHVGENGLPQSSAPWFQKELELCREWGFQLKCGGERVSLSFDQDQLVPYWIQKETPAIAWDWLRVHGFFRIESTNSEALALARTGAPSGTLVYTEEQTAGKGRNGRSWFSSAGKGLYFTVVLRPTQPIQYWPLLTHAASVALVETLKDLSSPLKVIPHQLELDIKWPNDVLISGRKCAGILLEMIAEGESPAAVVGLGINVRKGSVPETLESTATCLDDAADVIVPRRQLLVRFLQNFQEFYLLFERGNHKELLDRWKAHSSMWNGADIWITDGSVCRSAVTCGLSEIGALKVRTPENTIETVFAGDISVRRMDNT
jgi:BirA family transcriptional regulator, biotin operon repressor / biotin---[acetyl-CoA-carboxylase] ligase